MPPGKFDGEKRGATTVDAQQIPDYVQQRLIDNKESEKYFLREYPKVLLTDYADIGKGRQNESENEDDVEESTQLD